MGHYAMTELSLNFREAAYAQETGVFPIALITLEHDDLAEPIRISTDPTQRITELTTDSDIVYGTVSDGETYVFLPIKIRLPDDTDEGPGQMTMEIDNIRQALTESIRSVSTPVSCQVDIVMSNDLDTVEMSWPEFMLFNIRYDAVTVTGTLQIETLTSEPFPAGSFTPGYFPALFQGVKRA
jgi:hypothetical protein